MNSIRILVFSLLVLSLLNNYVSAETFISEYSILHDQPHFNEISGKQLFLGICQGCHMSEGEGAIGAGYYPALANNEKLYASGYPICLVLEGSGNMPAFKKYLTDEQVMSVVNYIRTTMGNHARDSVSLADVQAISHR